jgi:hypothetical protein
MSSIFSGTERSTTLRRQALTPKLPLATALIVLGIVLFLFGLFLAPLIPADLRSGHRFWVWNIAVDEVTAVALIATGYIKKHMQGDCPPDLTVPCSPCPARAAGCTLNGQFLKRFPCPLDAPHDLL